MDETREQIVQEHIKQNQESILLAFDIARAFEDARRELILSALNEVETRLRHEHGEDLELENGFRETTWPRYIGFKVRKPTWGGELGVGYSAEASNARSFLVGVCRWSDDANPPPQLATTLDERIRSGHESFYWPWYYWLDDPYDHWDKREAIAKFAPRNQGPFKPEATEYLFDRIHEIVEAVDPVLSSIHEQTRES